MQFDEVVKKRKCVRAFKSKKASWKDIIEAIDSATRGPFAGNVNNIKFVIVENPDTIKKLAKHANQHWISQVGIAVVVCSDDKPLEQKYGERGRNYTKQQAGAAIVTLIFKLTDMGLNACWVGAFTDEFVRTVLRIPPHINVEAIIPIGYERPVPTPERRKIALENVLFWELWGIPRRATPFEEGPELERLPGDVF